MIDKNLITQNKTLNLCLLLRLSAENEITGTKPGEKAPENGEMLETTRGIGKACF